MDTRNKIFVALDGMGYGKACQLVASLTGLANPYTNAILGFKIHDIWDREGPGIITTLMGAGIGADIWVDLKLHDVPRTVGLRAKAIRGTKAEYLTVHALGGVEMMKAAVESGPKIIAITVLTSHSESEVRNRFRRLAHEMVIELAYDAKAAGVWGVVCSAHEVGVLSSNPDFRGIKLIVPGIRLAGKGAVDENQQRVNTPEAAFVAGANHIVVGSELTKADDPKSVLARIMYEIDKVPDK